MSRLPHQIPARTWANSLDRTWRLGDILALPTVPTSGSANVAAAVARVAPVGRDVDRDHNMLGVTVQAAFVATSVSVLATSPGANFPDRSGDRLLEAEDEAPRNLLSCVALRFTLHLRRGSL